MNNERICIHYGLKKVEKLVLRFVKGLYHHLLDCNWTVQQWSNHTMPQIQSEILTQTTVTGDFRCLSVIVQTADLWGGSDSFGPLRSQFPTVKVDGEGVDEGQQAEQYQADVHLQTSFYVGGQR